MSKETQKALLIAIIIAIIVNLSFPVAANADTRVGSVKATKSIPEVSPDDKVTILLTILNNGSVPVFDLEIYEYFNPSLQASGQVIISQPSGVAAQALAVGGLATAAQAITDPASPNILRPGESMTLRFTEQAPATGDFPIPADLVWFSYKLGDSTIRLSYYSNGLVLHVPNGVERAVLTLYPYVLAVTAFSATLTVLFWARSRLIKIRRRQGY